MTRKLLAILVATVALLGGCGGSSDSPDAGDSHNPDAATLQKLSARLQELFHVGQQSGVSTLELTATGFDLLRNQLACSPGRGR